MSNRKGSQFERDVARRLSMWISGGLRDDLFWRTAGSGARATTRLKKGLETCGSYGDIAATSDQGRVLTNIFVFSLKRGYSGGSPSKSVDILACLDRGGKPLFLKMWGEVEKLANRVGRRPCLIFKRDRGDVCVAFRYFDFVTYFFGDMVGKAFESVLVSLSDKVLIVCRLSDLEKFKLRKLKLT